MNNSTYRFTLDLQKHQSQMSIAVFQYDTAVRLHISLTDGGKPYLIADGSYAVLYGKRADGRAIAHDCQIQGNTEIIYDFEDTTACVAGAVDCQIKLYGTDQKLITAPKFMIAVDERVVSDDDIIAEGGELSAFDEIFFTENERIQAEKERAEAEKNRKGVFICYSAYPDGTDFTESWSRGQGYIGVATSKERPTDKGEFEWLLFKGDPGPTGNGIESIEHTSTSGLVDTYTITFTDKSTTTFNVTNGDPRLIFSEVSDIFVEAFLTNGTHGLLYHLYDDHAVCAGIGDSTETSIEIGSLVKGLPLINIGKTAFYYTKITSVTIPDSVTSIEEGAFMLSDVQNVVLPSGISRIENYTFMGCILLNNINIPDGVIYIGDSAFQNCDALTSITLPNGLQEIGNAAFVYCDGLSSMVIPSSVLRIGEHAFAECTGLTDIYYRGTEAQWNAITFGEEWNEETNATIHYNYGG